MQKIVPVLQDAFWCRVWCRLGLVGAVSACRAGLDKEVKDVFTDCKRDGKRSFWHSMSHSVLKLGGLLFSEFARMMKGGFWLHLEQVLKCDLVIIKKKNPPELTLLVHPSQKCFQNFILRVVSSHFLIYKEQESQERRQEWF